MTSPAPQDAASRSAPPSSPASGAAGAAPRVKIAPGGLWLSPGEHRSLRRPDSGVVPLIAGAVHYWRLDPDAWRPALEQVRALGCNLVDIYVPWNVHETGPGEVDLGRFDPRLDVVRFLRIAEECGLFAIVRPGPHINAELTWFGIPERVIWDADCQARSAGGQPVILPMLPLSFPVPSYASSSFFAETRQWFEAVLPALEPLCWPGGPIVMLQADNEGAFYFRDGVYEQDYHPDAIAEYRKFLQSRYHDVKRLREAHGDAEATFTKAEPPRSLNAEHANDLTRHLDWATFQEHLLANSLGRISGAIQECGLQGLPVAHNLPPGDQTTPLCPQLLCQELDLVGADYYHTATGDQLYAIARRTTDLSARAEANGFPCFAAELGAGFPPFFPPLRAADNEFAALSALAYGLRAFNIYMAVDRDRWLGAPISSSGEARPEAAFWRSLIAAMDRVGFAELERRVAVSLVVPRSFRRLARVLHAFGPVSQAAFEVMGRGLTQCIAEAGVDRVGGALIATQQLLDQLWARLEDLGISVGIIGGDLLDEAIERSAWVVVASCGALEADIASAAQRHYEAGGAISLGPFLPTRDASMQAAAYPIPAPRADSQLPWQLGLGGVMASVERALEELRLPRTHINKPLKITLHHDRQGTPRVAFVINPTSKATRARCHIEQLSGAQDCLTEQQFSVESGVLELEVAARSVRMLELSIKK